MPRVITIDPGKSKCGLVLAEISEKKVYEAIVVKSELLESYVRNLINAECISKIKFTAAPLRIMPDKRRRVRKDLPVPDLPKMPLLRSTNLSKSRHTGTSISIGLPTAKLRRLGSSSLPKTRLKSLTLAS